MPDSEIGSFLDSLAEFMANNKVEGEIVFPIEVSAIEKKGRVPRAEQIGSWCSIRPVSDTKTYLGVYLGDLQCDSNYSWSVKTHVLTVMPHSNPAIYVPDLKRVVWGYESWWGIIDSEEKLRQITDADIQNVWYVRALKEMAEKES